MEVRMEGSASTKSSFLYRLINFEGDRSKDGIQNHILQNIILPKETKDTKDKENILHYATPAYTTQDTLRTSSGTYLSNRTKSIQEAKNAFLCATITQNKGLPPVPKTNDPQLTSPHLNYAQITIASKSGDSRITGGGVHTPYDIKSTNGVKYINSINVEATPSFRKNNEVQTRKVSFKTKIGSSSHKRSTLSGKTTVTIASNKVAELTKKYNEMVQTKGGTLHQPKFAKNIEKIQNVSKQYPSNSSTPSSTLSASGSIKIIVRQKRSVRSRNFRKRCSSVDSIDKIVCLDSPKHKKKVSRTKSDGNRKKSPRKNLKHANTIKSIGPDEVDGIQHVPLIDDKLNKNIVSGTNTVKNAIKKFECEISASKLDINKELVNQSDTLKTEINVKPKVPEKKSYLCVTKNIVLKDGIPKIKTVRQDSSTERIINNDFFPEIKNDSNEPKKKDFICDRNKYKTSYIRNDKLTLKLVDIIQEDILDNNVFIDATKNPDVNEDEKQYQDIAARITPNESFLWRRKSSCPSNSDIENASETSSYGTVIQTKIQNETENIDLNYTKSQSKTSDYELSESSSVSESRFYIECSDSLTNSILDLESNLIEALNEQVIVNNITEPILALPEDDYEPFAIVSEAAVLIEPIRTSIERQSSKINCPLPEIPKESPLTSRKKSTRDNIYQCLTEMRSHPEGDESSVHSYELCDNALEERTRGDGDSDDGYEYCKSPSTPPILQSTNQNNKTIGEPKPLPPPPGPTSPRNKSNYEIAKSVSAASTVSYEKIGSEAVYEKIQPRPTLLKDLPQLPIGTRDSIVSSEYTGYNDGENIYDTIKQPDGVSISNCYESIPNSPSMVKLRNNFRKQLASVVQKRLSFDSMSNISRSTLSSEQKTNSIYGQRSMISFSGQEIAFPVPNSDSSVSDRSDRSEDWVDMSDQEEERNEDSKIVIVRERSRKSPISWSQKVRHQWQKSPKQKKVAIASASSVYLETCAKSAHYSGNDASLGRLLQQRAEGRDAPRRRPDRDPPEAQFWLVVKTVAREADVEVQDLCAFFEADSSDSSHYYESLNGAYEGSAGAGAGARTSSRAPTPYDDDFDSFDSDSDVESERPDTKIVGAGVEHARLPEPPAPTPATAHHTLTKFASVARRAAGKKMRELTRNFTKRHSDYGKTYEKSYEKTSPVRPEKESIRQKTKSMIYETFDKIRSPDSRVYGNVPPPDQKVYACSSAATGAEVQAPPSRLSGAFGDELKERVYEKRLSASNEKRLSASNEKRLSASNEKRLSASNEKGLSVSNGEAPPLDEPPTPPADRAKLKDSGTLSRKTYFSFKSRFRRASSMAVDINSEVPSALKITNSTFYLTDSMDGDSGFSNCSDSGHVNGGSAETLQPLAPARHPGTHSHRLHPKPHPKYESSPELTASSPPAPARLERPTAPPPPPPTDLCAVNAELKRLLPSLSKKEKGPRTRTSWYAECGQSELESPRVTGAPAPAPATAASAAAAPAGPPNASSWYAEVGLYQEGGGEGGGGGGAVPPSESSSSSGASSSASPLPQHSRFTGEPLYQFYNAAKVESVCRENIADSDSDGYETVSEIKRQVEATSMTAAWLVSGRGPSRTLWCELPEVHNSTLLNGLTATQKQLQEAKFELLTSEASYLNSLRVLETHFIGHPAFRDEPIITRTDWEILFGDIIPVRKCSQLLLSELEKCWQQNVLLRGLCEVVRRHADKHFRVYVKYCENQIFLVKTLQRLKSKPQFAEILTQLEAHPSCQSLSLHSFLMLPMQRVTRLPLLMDAVLRHLDPADDEYQACMDSLATLNDFVSQCNEGARSMERAEEMSRLAACIDFPAHMTRAPPLAPACRRRGAAPARWLVRSGELTHLVWRDDQKLTFGRKFQKVPLWLFLFTDLLVITKKRSEESYVVVDYCQRSLVEVSSGDVLTQLNIKESPGKHVMLLTLLENHENKTVEMLMSCASETDASRWREATAPPGSAGGESVYAGWDCPQVAVLYEYAPTQPDELALAEGDIVNVFRKMPEGWYYGERIRDGETGWFPGSYTVEVASPHVRARNLRTRYRLLALSASYLGQRKKT